MKNSHFLWTNLERAGFTIVPRNTAIISLLIGDANKAVQFSQQLMKEGIFIPAIRPPTVPLGSSRLRITVMATHTQEQLQMVVDKVSEIGRRMGVI